MSDIVRGTVTRSDVTTGCQQLSLDLLEGETDEGIEYYEQAGVSFRAYGDAEVLVAALGGSQQNRTAIGTSARGKRPTTAIEEGEGGLYFAGTFKVFLSADGGVYLGSPDATDWIALSSKVEAELTKIKTAISGAAVLANDGGATFKANIIAALTSSSMGASGSTASTSTKAT
jgi:phage gp45-like